MAIGICGASGYIGVKLYNYLVNAGEKIFATYCHTDLWKSRMHRFDLREDPLDFFDECDFVVIAAGYAKIAFCEDNKIEAFWLNVYRTRELLSHLTEKGIPAIFISSDAAERGNTTYGKYKRQVEKYIEQEKLAAIYLRPGKINDDNMLQLCEVIYANIKHWRTGHLVSEVGVCHG